MPNNKIILLDSNSLIHRAYHALPNLKSTKGMHTGAIFGFMTILLRLIKEQKPTHIAAAFDLKAPTFRHKMFDAYKGTRKPMDQELREQIEPLKVLISAMGIKIVSLEGYEADDILGTLSHRFDEDTIIVTGDRDSFQLVNDTTKIFWTKKGVSNIEIYDTQRLLDDGFTVPQFIDYKALRGDPSDNIPGISGVGEKTARALLERFGSLEEILDHADEIKGKIGQTIKNSREIAFLSRDLARIDLNVPVECTLKDLEFNGIYSNEVRTLLREYEINSLEKRMDFEVVEQEIPSAREIKKDVIEIDSINALKKVIKGDKLALYLGDKIHFAVDEKTEYIVAGSNIGEIEQMSLFGSDNELDFDNVMSEILMLCKDMKLYCYDFKALSKRFGFQNEFFDIMIASHLARESAPIKSIETVLGGEGLDLGAVEILIASQELCKKLNELQLEKLFFDVEQPLAVVLKNMEERGFSASFGQLEALGQKYGEKLKSLTNEIYALCGMEFNIASPKQLGNVLFENLGLKHGKKTKTGYSVSEDVLTKMIDVHPVISCILEWRHFAKLQSTYIKGLQPLIENGKIHTDFKQCITQTGRLSSTNPNLQNIPVKGMEAKDVKSAFTASKGNMLVSADYSQIELRLLAHLSGDKALIDAYNRADDIHALTASQILDVPIEEITSEQRRSAKAVNFGIVYGMSSFGLGESLSIPKYKAKEFIEKYFETYPTVKAYLDGNIQFAKDNGYAITLLGRRRNLQDVNASNHFVRSSAERMAMNTPLQGSAADIVKVAMLNVEKRLENMKSKMILQVHDELIIDTAIDEVEKVKDILKTEMENAFDLKVPLIANVACAENWGDLK